MTSRARIFQELKSFDHRSLSGSELAEYSLALLARDCPDADRFYQEFLGRTPTEPFRPLETVDRAEADALLANTFNFYGEVHVLGSEIDWEHNPGTDHWGHDLNRFTFLRKLVTVSLRTGDDRYARKAAALVLDWVAKTDVCHAPQWDGGSPYVWRSYLNIAIHLTAWTDVIDTIAGFMTPAQFLGVIKAVYDQLRWLEKVIPTMSNNWVVIGACGMMETAVRLPELKDRDHFIAYAWARLVEEADKEVLADGVQFELAQCYHLVVLERFARSADLCRTAGLEVPAVMEQVIPAMTDYLMQCVTPDGRALSANDSDPDAGPRFRQFLADQGRRRERADWLYVGTGGSEGRQPQVLSQAFEHGGVYIMRTGWEREALHLAFDGGPWGRSHQHDDKLAFQLTACGRGFVVDPGRYLYDSHNPFTPFLRSTHAHSTITIDGAGQADRHFPDLAVPDRRFTENGWTDAGTVTRACSEHLLGYGDKGAIRVTHCRAVILKRPDLVLVVDRLEGAGTHTIDSRLQFAPADLGHADGAWHTCFDDANLAVIPWMSVPFDTAVHKGMLEPQPAGWYSDGVNKIVPAPVLAVTVTAVLPVYAVFLLVPYPGKARPALELTVEDDTIRAAAGGTVFETMLDEALGLPE